MDQVRKAFSISTIAIAGGLAADSGHALDTSDFVFESGANPANYTLQGKASDVYSIADELPSDVLDNIYSMLPEGTEVNSAFIAPERYSSIDIDSELGGAANATVKITFLNEGAGYRNSLGYFVYETDNPPSDKDLIESHVIIFPNASKPNAGEMLEGDTIDLSVELTTGQSIGFFVIPNGWGWSGSYNTISSLGSWNTPFYSLPDLNPESTSENRRHNVVFIDNLNEFLVMGFEDLRRPDGDNDFNDLLFTVEVTPFMAIDGVNADGSVDSKYEVLVQDSDPNLTVTSNYPSASGYATMAFEDRWPLVGDYDFNDVVLQYQVTELLNSQRQVMKITYDYTVQAMGAAYSNGVGLKLPTVLPKNIESATLTRNGVAVEHDIIKSGESEAVLIITENLHDDLNDQGVFSDSCSFYRTQEGCDEIQAAGVLNYQLIVELSTPAARDQLGYPPYDSFIFASENTYHGDFAASPPGYTWQTHFKNYEGTSFMNLAFFNVFDDHSDSDYCFITENNMPWAINVRDVWDHPRERVDISQAYTHFPTWVISSGESHSDWYRNPVVSNIVSSSN